MKKTSSDHETVVDGGQDRLAELEAAVETVAARKRERCEAYINGVTTELLEIYRGIGVLRQDLAKAELFERASVLKAPVPGRVQQLAINTLAFSIGASIDW